MILSLHRTSIGMRLALIVLAAVVINLLMTGDRLIKRSNDIYMARMGQVKTAVEAGYSIVADYQARVESGEMTRADAEAAVKRALSAIRYSEGEYLFVLDDTVKMVLNPMTPKSVGQDRSSNKDSNGKLFSVEMVRLAMEKGEGITDYLFPKPGGTEPVGKAVFVKRFAPWGWVICSGVYTDDVSRAVRAEMIQQGAISFVALILMALVCLVISRAISQPLLDLTETMRQIAEGDLSIEVAHTQGREIGAMQEAVQVFKDNAREIARLTAQQHETAERGARERRQMLLGLASEFEASVTGVANEVYQSSQNMHGAAETMADNANQATTKLEATSRACSEASNSVSTVAAATEELSIAISEITRQINQSAEISRQAVVAVGETDAIVAGLSEAAQKIGDIISLINDIASQTNLLALNATIEAARAGDAGKGFAVVAGEVKHLATQTSSATGEIALQIASVQAQTAQAVGAIRGINSTIQEISRIGSAIASAVEEQGTATSEISRSTLMAAERTLTVSKTVADVLSTATDAGRAATRIAKGSENLARQSMTLRDSVGRFLSGIQSAG